MSLPENGLSLLTPVLMLAVYFALYCLIGGMTALIGSRGKADGLRQACREKPLAVSRRG